MAKRVFSTASSSFTAIADGSSTASTSGMNIQSSSATTQLNVLEISVSGQASASTLANCLFARNSTAGTTTFTALASPFSDGAMYGNTVGSAATTYTANGGTAPLRSAATTQSRLNLSLNGFGGIYRWVAAPGEEWNIYGTANAFESSFSLTTAGSGATCTLGVHIVYEPI